MYLTIGVIMFLWGIWLFKISPVSKYQRRVIGKYPLGELKIRKPVTPDEPAKDFNDWQYHIFKLRNSKQ